MLPTRNGVGPSCVGLPPGDWPLVIDFLIQRFPGVGAETLTARLARHEIVDEQGRSVALDDPYRAGGRLFYYRDVLNERAIAAQETVLFQDDRLVVADKPHGLPVTPSGQHLQETLLVRLRNRLGLDTLTPIHRIDQDTAGLVLFAKQPSLVHHYASLFAQRGVQKTYQAIASFRTELRFPLQRSTVLVPAAHFMQMREWEVGDAPTRSVPAHTTVELLEVSGEFGRYQLTPHSGRRHQLRVHMCALGLPIVGDRIYPALMPEGSGKGTVPLQLLAQRMSFTDPVTGETREFHSEFTLDLPTPASAG